MSRVITFSRTFPAYHPKAGQPTFFVEQILNTILPRNEHFGIDLCDLPAHLKHLLNDFVLIDGSTKWHTIRAGRRWKVGDKFSPRVWSGKPYQSKQIAIIPDIEIKKIWNFEIADNNLILDGKELSHAQWIDLAKNDGLKVDEMLNWFRYPHEFSGQIICWNPNLEY